MAGKPAKERREIRERLQARIRVLVESVYLLISTHPKTTKRHGYHMDKRAIVEIRFRNGRYRQFCVNYAAGDFQFQEWETGGSLTKLPTGFDASDPQATLTQPLPLKASKIA
jgi:hypothetical protein